jgi:enoyl-CoA hydratase/carnithine racemase
MPHPLIRIDREGEIALVTIDRATKRNALDLPMWIALAEAMEAASTDETLRCVVVRGAGEVAFSAGADIAAFPQERGTPEREAVYGREISRAFQSIRRCVHPVVAACRGWTMGGGCGIATMADFRIGGPGTRMGIPERNLSLFYHYGELDPLLESVGYAVACECARSVQPKPRISKNSAAATPCRAWGSAPRAPTGARPAARHSAPPGRVPARCG